MKKFERQAAITEMVKGHNYVLITDIINKLHASDATIRRDIKEMEERRLVTRNQGAVIWNDTQDEQHKELVFYRQSQNIDSKKELGKYSASMVRQNDTLFIDTGTTMLELARNLEDIPLTVVTNDLPIAMELEKKYNISTIVLGGCVRRGTHTMVGSIALNNLKDFHFQKAFFSPAGIDQEGEFMFFNLYAMDVRQKAASASEEIIMVADHSKFGCKGFIKGFGFSQCSCLITDQVNDSWNAFLDGKLKVFTTAEAKALQK